MLYEIVWYSKFLMEMRHTYKVNWGYTHRIFTSFVWLIMYWQSHYSDPFSFLTTITTNLRVGWPKTMLNSTTEPSGLSWNHHRQYEHFCFRESICMSLSPSHKLQSGCSFPKKWTQNRCFSYYSNAEKRHHDQETSRKTIFHIFFKKRI